MLRLLVLVPLLLAGCRAAPVPAQERPVSEPPARVAVDDTVRHEAAVGTEGMVVSGHPEATRVGVDVLRAGGNAVDAAVATAFALAVVLPYAGNVGGGGFMVIRTADGEATTLDFREVAPGAATRDMFLGEDGEPDPERSRVGPLAVGVPGTPAGLLHALEKFGTLDRPAVLDAAIALAEDGFPLTEKQARRLNRQRDAFARFPSTARYFIKGDTSYFVPDETLVQTDLGGVLRRIRDAGHDGFYAGETADLIVAQMEASGGLITHDDLAAYAPVEREPVTGTYRGYRVISMPPPSSGGIALGQLLNAVEPVDLGAYRFQSVRAVHRMAEAMRRAYADRAVWLGDPGFVEVPQRGLLSKGYMRSRMADFNPRRASSSEAVGAGVPPGAPESSETTHLSVVDAAGNAVSLTTTVNDLYGSKLVVDGAGFFLNDEMDDFTAKPGAPNLWGSVTGTRNAVEPGKRMVSSMTPTVVEDPEGRLFLVVGTPGGTTIITTVYQVITGIIDFGLTLPEAIAAPRFHHQWDPDRLFLERGFSEATAGALEAMGWDVRWRGGTSGAVSAIRVFHEDGRRRLVGAVDPRRDVTPLGY